jgi:hypothetical protein
MSESGSSEDSWKVEYDQHVQSWRARSAEAREKAEKERARWEAIRAAEKTDSSHRSAAGVSVQQPDHDPGWERLGRNSNPSGVPSEAPSGSAPNPENRENIGLEGPFLQVRFAQWSILHTYLQTFLLAQRVPDHRLSGVTVLANFPSHKNGKK